MADQDIAAAIARARAYLKAHPANARYRDGPAIATIEGGLRVRVGGDDGAALVTDMVTGVGGGGSAPSPGWIFRAAYASCVATLIAMRAAEKGTSLEDLRVTVDSESDDRGILGIDETVPSGPLGVRIVVSVASDVSAERIREIIEWGVAHCPVHYAVSRAVPIDLQVQVR